jgi:hypothetical protein
VQRINMAETWLDFELIDWKSVVWQEKAEIYLRNCKRSTPRGFVSGFRNRT